MTRSRPRRSKRSRVSLTWRDRSVDRPSHGYARRYPWAAARRARFVSKIYSATRAATCSEASKILPLRRIDQADGEVLSVTCSATASRRDDEHFLGHARRFGREDGHAHRREDIDVVALAGHEIMSVDLDGREWTSARENRAAMRPAIGLLRRAFRARGRVGIGKDDRTFVDLGHGFDDLLIEQLRHGADADDAGRPQRLDRIDEFGDRRMVERERLLEIGEIGARCHDKAVDVEQRVARPRRLEVSALRAPSPR